MFAYCGNNSVKRFDETGTVWETVFDVISLGLSIVEVAMNPNDPWAWAGLIGDTVDLIPFVCGVGEVTRVVKTGKKIIDTADTAYDSIKAADTLVDTKKAAERTSAVRKAWKNEFDNVAMGGTGVSRQWTPLEMEELLQTGKVKGYQGHHMKSVKVYPDLAGDPTNIQFLTRENHLKAHNGNWRNPTHGRYFE